MPTDKAASGRKGKSFGGPSEAGARISYLYRAAKEVSKSQPSGANRILSSHLTHLMVGISKKAVVKNTSAVKKTICKGCHGLLLPGNSATVEEPRVQPINVPVLS